MKKSFLPKPSWDLSVAAILALQQMSVINDLRGTKECRDREKEVKQQCNHKAEYRLPWCSDGRESSHHVGDLGLIPALGRPPGGGHGNLLLYSCLENPHGQRSLVGYSPWGHKEADRTQRRVLIPSEGIHHIKMYL